MEIVVVAGALLIGAIVIGAMRSGASDGSGTWGWFPFVGASGDGGGAG